jgi:8-oxo-dGTP pyrophosphatase MutT (NUDIX family)
MSSNAPLYRPPRLRSRSIARYPFLELVEHDIRDETGAERAVLTIELCDWCVAVARDKAGRFVLVEQHRHGVDAVTLEPAGGIVDPGEDPAEAALRELVEETGYAGAAAVPLGWVHPNPALSANRSFAYLIDGVEKVREPDKTPDEQTHVVLLDDADLDLAVSDGRITHALAVVALLRARRKLAEPGR